MFTKTMIALATVLVLGTSSAALAEQEYNPNDRQPGPVAFQMARTTISEIRAAATHTVRRLTVAEKWSFDRASKVLGL